MVSETNSGLLDESRVSPEASSSALDSESVESSSAGSKSTKTSPRAYATVRRGPVVVSSDEESESEPIRPRVLRAPSKTPSWAKSSVSPSPPRGAFQGTDSSKSVSDKDIESDDGLRQRKSTSTGSKTPTKRSSSRALPKTTGSTTMDLVTGTESPRWGSVFGSDSAHESDSGESGRIRNTRAGSEKSWSQSPSPTQSVPMSPSPSASGSSSGDDSEGELNLGEDDPQLRQSPPRRSSVSPNEGFGVEGNLGSQPLSYSDVESDSPPEDISPDSPPKMLDGPFEEEGVEAGEGDDQEEKSKSKTSPRPRQSFSKRGSVTPGKSSGKKRRSKPKSSGDSDVESKSLEEAAPPNTSPKTPRSPSSSEFDESSSEERELAISDAKLDSKTRPKGPNTFSLAPRAKKPRSERFHKARGQVHKVNPEYVKLLNEDIRHAASRGVYGYEGDLMSGAEIKKGQRSRMIMGSVWTVDEQVALFKHISVVGKDNLPELTRGVGTKSVIECRAYLKALQDGREDYVEFPILNESRRGQDLVSAKDIPAAIELSDECVKALEEDADFLERRTREHEERMEQTKWGDSWLLDLTTAEEIEHLYRNKRIKEIHDIAPEAELLNVNQMLDLSECIFMYGPEESWKHLGEELPSIRHTALSDIHTLVVSLTKRIVQASLFMAMSRLRSMDDKVFKPRSLVRPSDVEAAIDSLGVPRKSNYWVKLPRKLGMKVYRKVEQIRLKSDKNAIPYDEVEDYLERERRRKFGRWGSSLGLSPRQGIAGGGDDPDPEIDMDALITSAYEESEEEEEEGADDELSSTDDPTGIGSGGSSSNTKDEDEDYRFISEAKGIHRSQSQKKWDTMVAALEDEEDSFMEALDQKQSLEAEKALWQMLGKKPSTPLPKDTIKLPKVPIRQRKRGPEAFDWRDGVDYLAPWETTKRRKTEHDEAEDEVMDEEESEEESEDEETDSVPVSKRTLTSAASAPEEIPALQKTKVIPSKRAAIKKKKQPVKPTKSPILVASSPRKSRVRRQSKAFSGFVSTIENVIESDVEALAREQGDDDFSEEEQEDE